MTWRWSWHPWGPLCCGLLSAVLAVYVMHLYIDQQLSQHQPDAAPAQELPHIDVVVANQALEAGQSLSLATLSARRVPRAGVATDTVHPGHANGLVGLQLAHPVSAGQPIQRIHLSEAASGLFSELLNPGQRALTLNVSAQQSHSGLISVGDRVDFFDLSTPQPRLIDSAVKVIATGANFRPPIAADLGAGADYRQLTSDYRTLTFAIAAHKVPVYERLQGNQQLTFWLRAAQDQALVQVPDSPREVDWIIGGIRQHQAVPQGEHSWL